MNAPRRLRPELAELGDRIRLSARRVGKQREVAAAIGVSVCHLGRLQRGASEASRSALIKLAQLSGVRLEWLLTGEGPRYGAGPAAALNVAEHERTLRSSLPGLPPELEQLAKLAACMTGEVGVGMRARFAANLLEVVPSGAGLVRDARIPAKTTRAEARALAARLLRDLVTELEREEGGP